MISPAIERYRDALREEALAEQTVTELQRQSNLICASLDVAFRALRVCQEVTQIAAKGLREALEEANEASEED